MKEIERVDDFCFDWIFQPFAHQMQKLFGVDNFFLAKLSLIAMCGVRFINYYQQKEIGPVILNSFLLVGVFLLIHVVKIRCKYYFFLGAANPARIDLWCRFIRVSSIFIAGLVHVFGLVISRNQLTRFNFELHRVDDWFYLAMMYFMGCTPLPPSKSLVRKFIDAIDKLFKTDSLLSPTPDGNWSR